MEGKREALLREASKISLIDSYTLQDKLAELDSLKPCPYGAPHAVSIAFIFLFFLKSYMDVALS